MKLQRPLSLKCFKCSKVKEKQNNGNQYFFLASILLGIVCYSTGSYENALLFFAGTLKKQLLYVDNEEDHPFLEQSYIHLAVLYKTMGNIALSLAMWQSSLKVHKRQYGETSYLLSSDYKNIGMWQLGLGQVKESIESLQISERYSKIAQQELKEPEDIKDEKKLLSEVYFALYLSYVANSEWDKAISANEASLILNIELLGEADLNVANNYYLGSQIYLKKLQIDEAFNYVNKANQIIDLKPSKEPLLLSRYRFLRAKLYKMMEKNKEALQDIDETIRVTESNPQLYTDEVEAKNFRRNLLAWLTDEEKKEYDINEDVEIVKEQQDIVKGKMIESQIKKSLMEKSLRSQGIDPASVKDEEIAKTEEEDEEESFLESPLGALSVIGGLLAIGAGALYFWKKQK